MISDLLNLDLPLLVKPYVRRRLQDQLDRIKGLDGFLYDSQGEKLRFDPENEPTPPRGQGVQLCTVV